MKWKFITEDKNWHFIIEADDHESAYKEAYDYYGPEVQDMMYQQIKKGELNGECNRTACSSQNAMFYNHSTRMHYCSSCAYEINRWAPAFKKEKGHELCVIVKSDFR